MDKIFVISILASTAISLLAYAWFFYYIPSNVPPCQSCPVQASQVSFPSNIANKTWFNWVLVQKGTHFAGRGGEIEPLGSFVFNDTVNITGRIISLQPAILYICKSVILHPSNQSAPICTGEGNVVSQLYDITNFGKCWNRYNPDETICVGNGITLYPGRYHLLIYTAYPNGIMFMTDLKAGTKIPQRVVDVAIPPAAYNQDSGLNFDPQDVNLTIGVNNTVRWTNYDIKLHYIMSDSHSDLGFAKATSSEMYEGPSFKSPNVLGPGDSFNFTFTKPGTFGYHSEPWLHGWIHVFAPTT